MQNPESTTCIGAEGTVSRRHVVLHTVGCTDRRTNALAILCRWQAASNQRGQSKYSSVQYRNGVSAVPVDEQLKRGRPTRANELVTLQNRRLL